MNEQLDRIELKLAELQGKIETMSQSTEKTRKYLMWGFWVTIAVIVIPLLLFPLVLPAFMQSLVLPAGY
jgi:hypothetical protein